MCSFTSAVWIIALVEIVFLVGAFFLRNWVALAISGVVLLTLSFIMCNPKSVFIRRLAFVVYLILTVIAIVDVIFVTVLLGFVNGRLDKTFADYCLEHPEIYPDRFSTLDECVSFVRTVTITLFALICFTVLILRVCFCRVLYHGMLE